MSMRFTGSTCLITGGTSDMAMALAPKMILSGLFPVLTFRSESGQKKLASRLRDFEEKYAMVHLDLDHVHSIHQAFETLNHDLDYLVDFAQDNLEGLVAATDSQRVQSFFEASLSNRAILIKAAARAMLTKKKGRMVYVSSTAAGRQSRGQGFYAAVKNGAESLYHAVGIELAGKGITTVCLRPGYVDAGRAKSFIEKHGQRVLDQIPMGRVLSCEEIADVILFLLTDSAVGINATSIIMDGGMSALK